MIDSKFSNEDKFLLNFNVSFYQHINSVRIYHLLITHHSSNKLYSFYFRYNTIRELFENCHNHQSLPKNIKFPSKINCCPLKDKNRQYEFQDNFFSKFRESKKDLLSFSEFEFGQNEKNPMNISLFLDIFGLNFSLSSKDFLNFYPLPTKLKCNPFEKEKPPFLPAIESEHPFMRKSQKKFKLKINGKIFEFFEQNKLGEGGYGKVFKYSFGSKDSEDYCFAVKFVQLRKQKNDEESKEINQRLIKAVLSESHILTKFDHENVVRSLYFFKTTLSNEKKNREDEAKSYFCNIMEYCNNKNLMEILKEYKNKNLFIPESEIIDIFCDILKGMKYVRSVIQSENDLEIIIHRDLKPENILFHINKDKRRIAKVGDFGHAKIHFVWLKNECSGETSINYQAPEIAMGRRVDEKCDIWSLGIILYEMCFLKIPWGKKERSYQTMEAQKQLYGDKELSFAGAKRKISENLRKLLVKMIRFEPKDRISFKELFENELFKRNLSEFPVIMKKNKNNNQAKSENMFFQEKAAMGKKDCVISQAPNPNQTKLEEDFREFLEILEKRRNNEEEQKINKSEIQSIGIGIFPEKEEEKNIEDSEMMDTEPLDFGLQNDDEGNNNNQNMFAFPNNSVFTNNKIRTSYKKQENKVIFLQFLDRKLEDFYERYMIRFNFKHITVLRFFLCKIRINILLRTLKDVELIPENSNLWPMIDELKKYVKNNPMIHSTILNYLNEATEKFMFLQKEIFSAILANGKINNLFLGEKIENPTTIIHIVNPQIKDWTDFFKLFRIAFDEIFDSLNNYVKENIAKALEERLSEQQKNENRDIVMMLKNLCVLIQIKEIFDSMEESTANEMSLEKFEKNDQIQYQLVLNKMDF